MANNSALDKFSDDWDLADPDHVLLAKVLNSEVVPMAAGFVAMLVETPLREGGTNKSQSILSPDYARRLGASLIAAANMVNKGDG